MNKSGDIDSLKWAGIGFIAVTGLLHLIEAPEYFGEQRYIGVLFALAAIGAVVSAIGIYAEVSWGWILGILVAAGSALGYVLSRTIGLPRFRENSWAQFLEPVGIASLVAEILFVACAMVFLSRDDMTSPHVRREYVV